MANNEKIDENENSVSESLFPEFLDRETPEAKAATAALQLMLIVAGYDSNEKLLPDGIFGDVTEQAVRDLQGDLRVVVDGKFGPETRQAFFDKFGINVDQIPADPFRVGHA